MVFFPLDSFFVFRPIGRPARPRQTGARQSPVTAVCTSGAFVALAAGPSRSSRNGFWVHQHRVNEPKNPFLGGTEDDNERNQARQHHEPEVLSRELTAGEATPLPENETWEAAMERMTAASEPAEIDEEPTSGSWKCFRRDSWPAATSASPKDGTLSALLETQRPVLRQVARLDADQDRVCRLRSTMTAAA